MYVCERERESGRLAQHDEVPDRGDTRKHTGEAERQNQSRRERDRHTDIQTKQERQRDRIMRRE